jgi:hypothetical protein
METKQVELPSGQKARVRKPGFLSLAEAQQAGDNTQALLRLVVRCTESPKLSLDWRPKGDDAISVEELDPVDVIALAQEIKKLGGLDDMEARIAPLSKTGSSA